MSSASAVPTQAQTEDSTGHQFPLVEGRQFCTETLPMWLNREREGALASLNALEDPPDPEAGHRWADQTLCDLLTILGFSDVVAAWDKVHKWYG